MDGETDRRRPRNETRAWQQAQNAMPMGTDEHVVTSKRFSRVVGTSSHLKGVSAL